MILIWKSVHPNFPKSFNCPFFSANDPDTFKQHAIDSAKELYSNYYRTHPLTLYGLNDQLYHLMPQYSPQASCAPARQRAEKTLFGEGGELIALEKSDLRHAYGVFCELPQSIKPSANDNYLSHWIQQGGAYESYLSMNVVAIIAKPE